MIHGLTPGNMIGGFEPKQHRRYEWEFATCPSCGGRMHRDARLCQACWNKERSTLSDEQRAERKERQERFDLALQAGWTLEDIYGYDPDEPYDPSKDKLPSRREIVKRMIENWYKGGISE